MSERPDLEPSTGDVTLDDAKRQRLSGLMVGTSGNQVSLCRLVEGDIEWRENWDPDEARGIGKRIIELAKQVEADAGPPGR